jgi:phthalate 4,5-dioxygenase
MTNLGAGAVDSQRNRNVAMLYRRPLSRQPPIGVEDAEVFRGARSGYFVSDDKSPWLEIYVNQLTAALHPSSTPLRAAE